MAQPISKSLFCKYKRLERRTSFIISGSHDHKLVWAYFLYRCNFNRVPERKTLPDHFAKAKLPSLYFVGYRSSNDCVNKIMT
jgi:hypothetical protein